MLNLIKSIKSQFRSVHIFAASLTLLCIIGCSKYYVYPNHPSDPEPINKSMLAELRVSNFLILSIDGKQFEDNLQDYGLSFGIIGIGKVDGKSQFYMTPGKHTIRLTYFAVRIHNYAKNRVIDTFTSKENAILEVDLKEGQMVCICFKNLTPANSNEFIVVAEAREYPDKRDFQPPVYIPYISQLNFLPADCAGGQGENAILLSKSNEVFVNQSVDSKNKANIITY